MRNGVNISSISERVHELRASPSEAAVRYGAQLSLHPDRLVGRTTTLQAGRIRVPRDFRLEGRRTGAAGGHARPSAPEYLVAALASGSMFTVLCGCTTKGITLSTLSMTVTSERQRGPAGDDLDRFRYVLEVDADCDPAMIGDVAHTMSRLSPNHRTLVEPNEVALTVEVVGQGGVLRRSLTAAAAADDGGETEHSTSVEQLHCALRSEYGMQSSGEVWSNEREGRRPIRADQPKQYLGTDWAPNPQEYLLSALGMDVLDGLAADEAARETPSELQWAEIGIGGTVDLRGALHVEPEAPVRVHGISGTLTLTVAGEAGPWVARVEQALQRSAVRRAVCCPQAADMEIYVHGTRLMTRSAM